MCTQIKGQNLSLNLLHLQMLSNVWVWIIIFHARKCMIHITVVGLISSDHFEQVLRTVCQFTC